MFRVELLKAARRWRTWLLAAAIAGIPAVIVFAIRVSPPQPAAAEDAPPFLFQIATNGLYAALTGLAVVQPFFLPLAAGLFAGDAIAGEAQGGTLRYLLLRPVGRSRLVLSKYGSAMALLGVLVAVTIVSGVVAGAVVFGLGPVPTLSGTELSVAQGLLRIVGSGAYMVFALSGIACIGLLISTRTDSGPRPPPSTCRFEILFSIAVGASFPNPSTSWPGERDLASGRTGVGRVPRVGSTSRPAPSCTAPQPSRSRPTRSGNRTARSRPASERDPARLAWVPADESCAGSIPAASIVGSTEPFLEPIAPERTAAGRPQHNQHQPRCEVGRARSSWPYEARRFDTRMAVRALCTTLVVAALFAAGCGSSGDSRVERTLEDPAGDVAASTGPDVVAVTVERDDETISFRVRFATELPLEVSEEEGWIDMLLIGVDVPPLGPPPAAPGGEWRGADYFLGTHGPSETGMIVRLPASASEDEATGEKRADFPVAIDGATLSLLVPRDELGDPGTLTISIAAAREWNEAKDEPAEVTPDVVPDTGTWTVEFD